LFPESFADRIAELAGTGVTVTAYDAAWLKKRGMGGILGVSAGSARESRLVEVEYRPAEAKNSDQTVLLVGKGVTFDSGGLVLKPREGLNTMKGDMGGAAVLAGITSILHELKPNRPVRILMPLAENMTGGAATKVGDVLHMYGGKTVEVMNTDAEGRLILADALAYGAERSPSVVLDLATLTGASVVALGKLCSTVMGNSPEIVRDVLSSAEKAGELMWELPLIEAYKKQLESKTADLKNVGERWGGAITAALFLSEFVNKLPWAHLDIAGPTWADKDEPAFPEGGTAHGVGTVIEFLSPSEE
jgi:leucyl aminopeptidase